MKYMIETTLHLFSISCVTLWSSLATCLWEIIFSMIAVITELWLSNSIKQTGRQDSWLKRRKYTPATYDNVYIHRVACVRCMSCASCFQLPLWCACCYKWAKKEEEKVHFLYSGSLQRNKLLSLVNWRIYLIFGPRIVSKAPWISKTGTEMFLNSNWRSSWPISASPSFLM